MAVNNINSQQVTINITDPIPPSNIATIDKDGLVGNAVSKDKFQIDLSAFKTEVQGMIDSDFKGVISPSDPAPKEDGSYKAAVSSRDNIDVDPNNYGTLYNNAGNYRAKEGYITYFYKKGSIWTKSEDKIIKDGKSIKQWETLIPSDFPLANSVEAVQIVKNGLIYQLKNGVSSLATDIPGSSSKWVEVVGDSKSINMLFNNGEFQKSDFVQKGFIYHGTDFPDGSIQGDWDNKTTNFISVKAGEKIHAKIAISNGGYAIGFYSQQNVNNFVAGVLGLDGSSLVDYEFACPSDGYILVCTSNYAYPNAFEESYYAINKSDYKPIYATPEDLANKEIKTFNFFAGHDQKPKSFNHQNATKIGQVITKSASGFDNGDVESPYIIWDCKLNKYVMVYTAYTAEHVGSIGWATSDDLVTWTKKGQLIQPSGIEANGDKYGMTGPCLTLYEGKYYLYYLGLNGAGYEGEPINLCLAVADSLEVPNWEYKGIKIPIQNGVEWANQAIYHANIVKADNKWYMFFNARGSINGVSAERTGFATSTSLSGPWTVDKKRISEFAELKHPGLFVMCGDPSLFEYNDVIYMFYFNLINEAVDHWAYTSKSEFPRGWTYGGQATNKTEPFENRYAHKPFCFRTKNKLYHFYTAADWEQRSIALQTFDL